MADLPTCRYCHKPYTIARETDDFWEMACEPCQVGHVFSKPKAKAAAKYLANLERERRAIYARKLRDARPKLFIPKIKGVTD